MAEEVAMGSMASMVKILKGPRDYKNVRINQSGKLVVDQTNFLKDQTVRKTVEALRTVKNNQPKSNSK